MHRHLILVSALAAVGCADATDALPAAVDQTQQAIRNGTRDPQILDLSDGQLLALGWLHSRGRPAQPFCTGTLISPNVVATARHCIDGRSGSRIAFGVGQHPEDPAATFPVAAAYGHPDVDAAVLVLGEDATDRLPELVPIRHNRVELTDEIIGREVEAGGFGETYDPSRSGRYFAVVELIGVQRTEITVDGRGRQGICFGDSGGPVMTTDDTGEIVVLAVESWGDQSCVGIDHLTRLDVLDEWLNAFIEGGVPETECGDLDYLGRCDGVVAEWCENGAIRRQDCGQRGQLCDFVSDDVGYFCLDNPPCGDVDSLGECDGDLLKRCRFGELVVQPCDTEAGEVCRSDRGGAFCGLPQPEEDAAPTPTPAEDAAPEPEPAADAGAPGGETDAGAPDEDATPGSDDEKSSGGGDGCVAAPGAPGGEAPAALALLGFLALRRRRGDRTTRA